MRHSQFQTPPNSALIAHGPSGPHCQGTICALCLSIVVAVAGASHPCGSPSQALEGVHRSSITVGGKPANSGGQEMVVVRGQNEKRVEHKRTSLHARTPRTPLSPFHVLLTKAPISVLLSPRTSLAFCHQHLEPVMYNNMRSMPVFSPSKSEWCTSARRQLRNTSGNKSS